MLIVCVEAGIWELAVDRDYSRTSQFLPDRTHWHILLWSDIIPKQRMQWHNPKPYDPLCFVTSIVHNTWSIVEHLHWTRNQTVPCNTSEERTEIRRIIGTYTQTHGLFKTSKVQTLYTLSINAKSAPHLALSYCSAVSCTQRKRFIWQKIVYFQNVSWKITRLEWCFCLLFMVNMKAISVTIQSPSKSNYALCVGTTLRAYKSPPESMFTKHHWIIYFWLK
jgi:hypothetical protein